MHRSIVTLSAFARCALLTAALLSALPAAAQPLSFVASYQSNPISSTNAIIVSGDGRHVYSAGYSYLALHERSPGTGALRFAGALELGALRLGGTFIDLALSPDGRHLYVAGDGRLFRSKLGLGVFARDTTTGALELIELHSKGPLGTASSDSLLRVVLSPDGRYLYALSRAKKLLSVYERNAASGKLQLVESVPVAIDEFSTQALAISPDGSLVVVGGEPLLTSFARNASNGRLAALGILDDLSDPQDALTAYRCDALAFSPDGRHLYAIARTGEDFESNQSRVVASFDRDPASGAPRFLRAPSTAQVETGTDLKMSPDGRHLYAVAEGDASIFNPRPSTVSVFTRNSASGALEPVQSVAEPLDEPTSRVFAAAVSPDGRHLYVGSFEGQPLAAFRRNRGSGLLSPSNVPIRGLDGFGGASAVAVSAGGGYVYIGARGQAALSRFERRADGLLFGGALFESDPGVDAALFSPWVVVASRDGRYLYVLGDGSTAIFTRNPTSGRPSFLQSFAPIAVDAVLSPDDRDLYALNRSGLSLLQRQGETFSIEQPILDGTYFYNASSLTISPDGRHLYVISWKAPDIYGANELYVFERHPSNGQLTLERAIDLRLAPYSVLQANQLVFDPDGRHGYLSVDLASGGSALLALERNETDGNLRLIEAESAGITFLYGRSSLAMDPGGAYVYTAASDKTLAVYSRNSANGRLVLEQVLREGKDGVSGIADLTALAAASDGRVYGVSETHSTLVVLRKDD